MAGPSVGASVDITPSTAVATRRLGPVEEGEAGGERQRDHRAADEALDGAEHDHRRQVPGHAAEQAGQR